MSPLSLICRALNLSDGQRCTEFATCHGLYAGYKKRNRQLDSLVQQAPEYLKSTKIPLANETFEDIEEKSVLNEIHTHLFRRYVLLGQVIDARKLHHKHFYSLKLDYGHQAYLNTLSNQRHIVLRALEKLVKQIAKVLYAKEKWFKWIGEAQLEEEMSREKEAKKVKLEAAMFRRHWKKMQTRLRAQREKEEKQRQEAFLEAAYQERMNIATETDEDMEMWDPIEDYLEDERGKYVGLIKHFLWMEIINDQEEEIPPVATASTNVTICVDNLTKAKGSTALSASVKSKSQSTADPAAANRTGQKKIMAMMAGHGASDVVSGKSAEPDKSNIETQEEMRKRLKEGVEKNYDELRGLVLVGSLENPHGTHEKTSPMGDDEIETLMQEIREIKLLLFCRLLLSQASLLPAALRAASVDEFLNDSEITEADLRDLCLKLEQPSLQDIRDACADFMRGDEPDVEEEEEDVYGDTSFEDIILQNQRFGRLQDREWFVLSMLAQQSKALGEPAPNLKDYFMPEIKKPKKMKIRICGKDIWNYSNESSMSRDGWLQFPVLAKDCDLKHAVQLCRNWDEFSHLNFLTSWQYFPASNWVSWGSDRLTKQLHDLEFFPIFFDLNAESFSHHYQAGGSRSRQRKSHHFVEARNVMVSHMKRNDSITRRFLQYCSMRTGEILLAVRDGRTGKVITAPSDETVLWTLRSKVGMGRATKNEWDSYEVWIWDLIPGEKGLLLYNIIVHELRKAWRITKPIDVYNHQETFLRTLTRDKKTMRVRSIKHVQNLENLFIATDGTNKKTWTVKGDAPMTVGRYIFYTKANAAEDAMLFPDELISPNRNVPFKEVSNVTTRLKAGAGTMTKYLAKVAKKQIQDEDGTVIKHWRLPRLWEDTIEEINRSHIDVERKNMLMRVGLSDGSSGLIRKSQNDAEFSKNLDNMNRLMLMEKDRGDETCAIINGILDQTRDCGSDLWLWFVVEILNWLEAKADNDEYATDMRAPWPHPFIIQDKLKAWGYMAIVFPELEQCEPATKFFKPEEGQKYRGSLLRNPHERSLTRPDTRTKTSFRYRPKEFWQEWEDILRKSKENQTYYADVFPTEWSVAIHPIIAKLYLAGIVSPIPVQNSSYAVPGFEIANTEPHRPGKVDLFIDYSDRMKASNLPTTWPGLVEPDQYPVFLLIARDFAASNKGARFALLRVWSAPHFWPAMMGDQNRLATSFLDGAARSWRWNFIPKDSPLSEWSMYNTLRLRLGTLKEQLGDRVVHRSDTILVMGVDQLDLFRYATAIREIDLWKSFVNVDIKFLEGLDPYWLD
ncbi:hypothetical protein F5Y19DRAFT_466640 [Xylariaceae sp. FL1651]|nr:hypothetical protein F5Y19DRAFT_466640 [Xylariaceae sp. FL1651]